jgi:hypothetical protein
MKHIPRETRSTGQTTHIVTQKDAYNRLANTRKSFLRHTHQPSCLSDLSNEGETDYLLHRKVSRVVHMYIPHPCLSKPNIRFVYEQGRGIATLVPSCRHTAEVRSICESRSKLSQSKESNVAHVVSLAREWRTNRPGWGIFESTA